MVKRYKILTDPNTLYKVGDMYRWKDDKLESWRIMSTDKWLGSTLLETTGDPETFNELIWRREIKKIRLG